MGANRTRTTVITAIGALVASALAATPSEAAPKKPQACDSRSNITYEKLLACVTVDGVREHQAAFQQIADDNNGTRADQSPGYEASVDYVLEVLDRAGWNAHTEAFTYTATVVALQQLTPITATYASTGFLGSGEGDVTGNVIPVDINLTPPRANSSGCEAADFAGLDFSGPNDVALVQRGTCTFAAKALNAQAAGAEAVVIFNQGNLDTPDRSGPYSGTLLPTTVGVPVVSASFADGAALAQAGSTARVNVDYVERTSKNVIAELPGRTSNNVVMAGAHLDSVAAGPGINDNGSGSAALLEVAEQMSKTRPENTVRFAWWGAEELGLIGSTAWVDQRTPEELAATALYLNFDMIGSPNYVFTIYDANQSSFPATAPIPSGSAAIERLFESFYTLRGEPYDDTAFSGRSDYQAFIFAGIPSSGLFTGAEVIKTAQQQSIWGGTAGQQFDPCYHQACDTYANNNNHALEVNSDAVAFAVLTYANSTESVNGVKGVAVPGDLQIPDPAGPEHTFAGPLGGGGPSNEHAEAEVR